MDLQRTVAVLQMELSTMRHRHAQEINCLRAKFAREKMIAENLSKQKLRLAKDEIAKLRLLSVRMPRNSSAAEEEK